MADYYAYLIGIDGRVSKRVPIVCDDDEEAKRFAKQMVDGHALELWQEGRKIATFEPVARMDGEVASDFLAGGGEMGALTRGFDWSKTSLGSPETWPQSLRVTVRLVLTSRHPMFIWWGPELIQFYNDAYRETMGPERHPSALGARGRDCWAEIWDIIGPQIEYVMAGNGATWHEDQLVPVTRHGRREDVWWTYSFGPIDFEGKVGGVLVVCKDVTSEHMAREALNLINEELKHRVKNILTVLGAEATQTFRDVSSKADLEKYLGRLAAFGRAHDLLTAANWASAPLQDVISTALIAYRTVIVTFPALEPPGQPKRALPKARSTSRVAKSFAVVVWTLVTVGVPLRLAAISEAIASRSVSCGVTQVTARPGPIGAGCVVAGSVGIGLALAR